MKPSLTLFHPLIRKWFIENIGKPTDIQSRAWPIISEGRHILVSAPTGSGKTTTLYSALELIKSVHRNIVTVEDPVEYQLEGINQIQAKASIGLDFAHALRSIVRQDPDIIMVGEIRDLETAEIAVQASLTGHLVLSTLHTNTAAGAVTRSEAASDRLDWASAWGAPVATVAGGGSNWATGQGATQAEARANARLVAAPKPLEAPKINAVLIAARNRVGPNNSHFSPTKGIRTVSKALTATMAANAGLQRCSIGALDA